MSDQEAPKLPKNEKIRLIKGISGVFHTPEIVEGQTSSTGKTIEVEVERDSTRTKTYRLDAEEILTGGLEVRRATTFKLYTPEAYVRQQKANYDPANGRNMNAFKEDRDLPEATHEVTEQ